MDEPIGEERTGLDRRDVLRRGAILGGALVWTVPAVQTLAGPAFAQGSPCVGRIQWTDSRGNCFYNTFVPSDDCCDCVAQYSPTFGVLLAAAYCTLAYGRCTLAGAGTC